MTNIEKLEVPETTQGSWEFPNLCLDKLRYFKSFKFPIESSNDVMEIRLKSNTQRYLILSKMLAEIDLR
jgi:hypothetical protein